ncbi:hypothetical protein FAI41_04520 [Acetobacteraceae bacterium]|nr:hypothetical protein FAI41_04520 [Acetobacteraceae bacterium]
MLLSHKYPQFSHLLAGYFNPDFTEEYGHYDKALEGFCQDACDYEEIQQTIHEIRSYLHSNPSSEEEIENFMDRLGNHYLYQNKGFTPLTWIHYIENYLQNYLNQHQK